MRLAVRPGLPRALLKLLFPGYVRHAEELVAGPGAYDNNGFRVPAVICGHRLNAVDLGGDLGALPSEARSAGGAIADLLSVSATVFDFVSVPVISVTGLSEI
jgi:hypothetical protein